MLKSDNVKNLLNEFVNEKRFRIHLQFSSVDIKNYIQDNKIT